MSNSKELECGYSVSYLKQLTWLRGVAAFLVVVSHITRGIEVKYTQDDNASINSFFSLFDMGSFGVVIFLVLSGCTLYISNSKKIRLGAIGNFYIKRIFRIWPAFIISLFFYILTGFVFRALYVEPLGHWIEKQFIHDYSLLNLISYVTLTFNYFGPDGLYNNAYWSLPIEFQYYLIFPLIVISIKYFKIGGPIIIGLILYIFPSYSVVSFSNEAVFYLAFSFCGGVVAGYIYEMYRLELNTLFGISSIVLLGVAASFIANDIVRMPNLTFFSSKWNCYSIIAIVIVMLLLATNIKLPKWIDSLLLYLGQISYSTYLYHNIFVAFSVLILIKFKIYNSDLRLLITAVLTIVLTYTAAGISYRYIESPSIIAGKKLNNIKSSNV